MRCDQPIADDSMLRFRATVLALLLRVVGRVGDARFEPFRVHVLVRFMPVLVVSGGRK